MKVYKGVMYRIIVEMACGCKSKQEFKDDLLREADGGPTYTACEKHEKSKVQAEMMEIILMEALEKEATDAKAAASIAVAQANVRVTDPSLEANPIGEGSTSETSSGLVVKVGNKIVNKRPVSTAVHQQTPAANLPPTTARPNPVRSNKVNLAGGAAASGLRRSAGSGGNASSTSDLIAQKKASLAAEAGGGSMNIDIEGASAVAEDPRITQLLVDDPDGGLLGDVERDPSRV